jgi:hypothetical protein
MLGLNFDQRCGVMPTQVESKPESGQREAAEHVTGAYYLLKTVQDKTVQGQDW